MPLSRNDIGPASGLLLCGGRSRRFGRAKARAPFRGRPLMEHALGALAAVCDEVWISVSDPEGPIPAGYAAVTDLYPGCGPLGGIHAGLLAARYDLLVVLACDMPFASGALLRYMLQHSAGFDAVVATRPAWPAPGETPPGEPDLRPEPLHAVYHRRSLAVIQDHLKRGERKIAPALARLRVRAIGPEEWGALPGVDPRWFENVNRIADLGRLSGET